MPASLQNLDKHSYGKPGYEIVLDSGYSEAVPADEGLFHTAGRVLPYQA